MKKPKLTKEIKKIVLFMETQAYNELDDRNEAQNKTINYDKDGFSLSIIFTFWPSFFDNKKLIPSDHIVKYVLYAYLKVGEDDYDISDLI